MSLPFSKNLTSRLIRIAIIYTTSSVFFIFRKEKTPDTYVRTLFEIIGYTSSFMGAFLFIHSVFVLGVPVFTYRGAWESGAHILFTMILNIFWTIAGYRLGIRWIHTFARTAFILIGAFAFFVNLILHNPLFIKIATGESHILNLVTFNSILPSLLLLVVGLTMKRLCSVEVRAVAIGISILWFFVGLNLMIRHFYHGSIMFIHPGELIRPIERLSYSALWLAYGCLLFVVGIVKNLRWSRVIALVFFFLTALKILWFDLPAITNSYRALAFFGTGIAFILIAYLFQRYGRETPT